MLYGGLIPFHLTKDPALIAEHWARVGSNPLISPDTGRRLSLPDVAQNLLLFVPFGLLGVWAVDGGSEREPRLRTIALVTGAALLLSAAVEALQLLTVDRVSSMADVGADTLGAVAGAVAWRPLRAFWARSSIAARVRAIARLAAFPVFLLTVLLVCAAAWLPFDVTLDVGNAVAKWHALRHDWWQSETLGRQMIGALRYALLALAAARVLRQAGARRPALWALAGAAAAAVGLEVTQLFIESRTPGVADAVSNALGALVGAVLARGWPYGRSASVWAAVVAGVSVVGVAIDWNATLEGLAVGGNSMALPEHLFEWLLIVSTVVMAFRLAHRR